MKRKGPLIVHLFFWLLIFTVLLWDTLAGVDPQPSRNEILIKIGYFAPTFDLDVQIRERLIRRLVRKGSSLEEASAEYERIVSDQEGLGRYFQLKYRFFWMFVSIAFLAIGIAGYVMKGGFRLHIDFSGGAELRVVFDESIDIGKVRDAMSAKGWKDAVIQSVDTAGKSFLIRVATLSGDAEEKIKDTLNSAAVGNKVRIDGKEWVGAEVGKDTTKNAVI